MRKFLWLAVAFAIAACSWRSPETIVLQVGVRASQPPYVAFEAVTHRPWVMSTRSNVTPGGCFFVNIPTPQQVATVAASKSFCWQAGTLSQPVRRSGTDSFMISLPVKPGSAQTVQVFQLRTSTGEADSCDRPVPVALAAGSFAVYYGGTVADLFAGTSVDISPDATKNGVVPSATCGGGSSSPQTLYIADYLNKRIRKISAITGTVTTIAGDGGSLLASDGSPAVSSPIGFPTAVALDSAGLVYFLESSSGKLVQIDADGNLKTLGAGFTSPEGFAIAADGTAYVANNGEHCINKLAPPSYSKLTVAGSCGVSGTPLVGAYPVPALGPTLKNPHGVALDANGDLLIADTYNGNVVKLQGGNLYLVGGNSTVGGAYIDNVTAVGAQLGNLLAVAVDGQGNIFLSDSLNFRVLKISASDGRVRAVAGDGNLGTTDGALGTSQVEYPREIVIDRSGNLYFAEMSQGTIRRIDSSAQTQRVIGIPLATSFAGDGGPGIAASFYYPRGLFLSP